MIRKATLDDLDAIWQLRLGTSKLLKDRGIDQWQYHLPDQKTFINDIQMNAFFVYDDGNIKGMLAIKKGIEPTYLKIYEGSWQEEAPYLTIHRLAVDHHYLGQGIAQKLMQFALDYAIHNDIFYMRIDTHENNRYAQRLFDAFGYQKQGYIFLDENHPGDRKRLAYDLVLDGGF